jgi:hypothetical protein
MNATRCRSRERPARFGMEKKTREARNKYRFQRLIPRINFCEIKSVESCVLILARCNIFYNIFSQYIPEMNIGDLTKIGEVRAEFEMREARVSGNSKDISIYILLWIWEKKAWRVAVDNKSLFVAMAKQYFFFIRRFRCTRDPADKSLTFTFAVRLTSLSHLDIPRLKNR